MDTFRFGLESPVLPNALPLLHYPVMNFIQTDRSVQAIRVLAVLALALIFCRPLPWRRI